MSRQNVEVVRAALDAFDRRDRDQVVALLDPKVEWELVGFLPDQERTRTGREQVWHYLTFLEGNHGVGTVSPGTEPVLVRAC